MFGIWLYLVLRLIYGAGKHRFYLDISFDEFVYMAAFLKGAWILLSKTHFLE